MELKVKIFGYAGDQLELLAKSLLSGKKIGYTVKENYLDAVLTLENQGEAEAAFRGYTADVLREVRGNMYAEGDRSLAEMAVEYLALYNKRLSIAESLTGGLVASLIVDIPGASKVLYEGLVTYSNESKIRRLGVSRYTIDSHGAVSYECAHEMAAGLLKTMEADIAVSTTGIAGPDGGSAAKPVGLTYICVADRADSRVFDHCFQGDRNSIRIQAANTALFYVINKLKNG